MLDSFFSPRSIAIIGASDSPETVRGKLVGNLRVCGYGGKIFPVSRSAAQVQGIEAFRDLASLPDRVDLAMIAVPPESLLEVVGDCALHGVKSVVIFSGVPQDASGKATQDGIARIARESEMRVLGPNSLGYFRPADGLAVSFAPLRPACRCSRRASAAA